MNKPVIYLRDIRFRYSKKDKDILNIAELQVHKGEHLFIQGSSGSGKTTLLNIITGITQAYTGDVHILDKTLQNMSVIQRDQFRVDDLGVIFQQFNLLPYLSLLENVQLPCWFSKQRSRLAGNTKQTAMRLLKELDIPEQLFNKSVNALSVGQQQRVAMARALIGQPKLIIADEPTSALDTNNRKRFLDLLFLEADKQGSTVVFVSHDSYMAKYFPQKIELSEINHIASNLSTA
ncbi:MAG: ABC transporter ATP-binding protein [Pseudomonadota bacterium]